MGQMAPDPAMLAALLGGGGGGPPMGPPGMGGPPPGMGGPPPGPPPGMPPGMMGGPPPGMDPSMMGPPPQEEKKRAGDILEEMLVLAKQYDDLENDPESQAAVAKMLADIRALQAKHQKMIDQAVGSSPATQMMRRNGG